MHIGYLTALDGVSKNSCHCFHHTVHVNAVFEEAELFVESELTDNVEGMVLELGSEIKTIASCCEFVKSLCEQT